MTNAPVDRPLDLDVPVDRTLSSGTPSTPLLGVLPLARLVPQDVHSVMDYANAATVASGAAFTRDSVAIAASVVLGVGGTAVSAASDYRLALVRWIPIETHEAIDYAWGVAAIAAPFVLGYWKRAPRVAVMHVVAGASSILSALVTDYRAFTRRR